MDFFNRARRLFAYGDLTGSNGESGGAPGDSFINSFNGGQNASANAKMRKRRRNMIVGVCVFGLCALAILVLTMRHKADVSEAQARILPDSFTSASCNNHLSSAKKLPEGTRRVKMEDFLYGKFRPSNFNEFNGTWINDAEFLVEDYNRGLLIHNMESGKDRKIMSLPHFSHFNAYKKQLSGDQLFLLLQINPEKIFRHSFMSEYVILPLTKGKVGNTEITLKPAGDNDPAPFPIRHATFAPKGNALVYVDEDNNIYYRASVYDQDEKLTQNGQHITFFNGVADWVTEEEVLEDDKAYWWAPDGKKIVFGSYNDTKVENYTLEDYGPWREIDPYPYIEQIAYPKVNMTNPTVTVTLVNFENGITQRVVAPPRSLEGQEVHFSWVEWVNEDFFAVQWMNRVQNVTVVTMCHVESIDDCVEIFANEEPSGWIEYKYRIYFDPAWDQNHSKSPNFAVILADPHAKHRYRQVVLVSDNARTFLTKREADVEKIHKWSTDGYIYFSAVGEDQIGTKNLYRVPSPNLKAKSAKVECLSCNFTTVAEVGRRSPCRHFTAVMSSDCSYYSLSCDGPDVPFSILVNTKDNSLHSVYDDNSKLAARLKNVAVPTIQHMQVPIRGTDLKAPVRMYLPPDFDPNTKYPMLVYFYGGPGSQMVDLSFNQYDYQTFLAGSKGFIYAMLDPRGTAGQGDEWRMSQYKNFGTVEIDAIMDVTKYLQSNLKYVDANRTALWGWSYGAFLSSSTLARDKEDVFKCGIAVAPVTDWTLYDTYYTERYMGLLDDNREGYRKSRVFNYIDNLKNKKLYLIHGTKDDNVHYQQSLLLSAALEQKDILFRQQSYTDQDHSILRYRKHLYHSITDFLLNDCFVEKKNVYERRK